MTNRRARLLGVLLGVLIPASVLFAQNASSLRGQVVDEHGAVIAGARATIVAADGKKRSAVANGNGEVQWSANVALLRPLEQRGRSSSRGVQSPV